MAKVLEYKGYIGSIEYSPKDKCFYGKLEMINDLVTFEADKASELEENFQKAVDDYLLTCKQLKREPQKTYKGVFSIRIDPSLHKLIYKQATKEGKSLNAYIQQVLSSSVRA